MRSLITRSGPYYPVLLIIKGDISHPLTRTDADPIFKACLSTARATPSFMVGQVLGEGGATTCFLATKYVESLLAHGDWASSPYTRYLAIPKPNQ